MRRSILSPMLFCLLLATSSAMANDHYVMNRAPLVQVPYGALPLGTIKPKGWLREMLERQRSGLTGNLDEAYAEVCGPRNGWLGGDGDGWERGPYWIDGALPLAYLLDDDALKEKVGAWIAWSLANQREDGYFGPVPFDAPPPNEPGLQRTKREDWWPKMVMLKVLQQHHAATGDPRVLELMLKYARFQLKELPTKPLDHWTYWGSQRGADNLAVVHWLYRQTGEALLLELGELLHEQTVDWTTVYSDGTFLSLNPLPNWHCVNVAQGLKAPIIRYQQQPEQRYLDAVKTGLEHIRRAHGYVNGMYGGDEHMHGNSPTQGSELCSATEMMFSFESILPITGDVYYADYLEKVAFNVLPAQHDDDFTRRQYFQQVNQVQVDAHRRNFFNDDNARIAYGVLTGYPCCTANMHQGWPKFTQNLWYATQDNGLAALVYGPSEVTAKVSDGVEVTITEETNYPFEERIRFTVRLPKPTRFPLHLRVPAWCEDAQILIGGKNVGEAPAGQIVKLDRVWGTLETIELRLPMAIRTSRWAERSVGIERGPLVYALRIGEEWREVNDPAHKHSFFEVYPTDAWNYGLTEKSLDNLNFEVEVDSEVSDYPWNLENAPIRMKARAKRIPEWTLYNHSAGPLPRSPWPAGDAPVEEVILIPYGCTTLRIAQFPVVR